MSWVEKSLGEVLKLEYGKPLDKSLRKEGGKYPAYGANGIKAWSDEYFHDEETIVVGRKGSAGELTLTDGKFWPLDVTYFVKTNKNDYDIKFLYYLLLSLDLPSLATGVKPGINRNNVYKIQAKFPSYSTQKQVAGQLDKAFADIEQARANTEQNLQNARELFDSYLQQVFSERGEDWEETNLGVISELKNGLNYTQASKGELVKIVGVKNFKDKFYISNDELETIQIDGTLSEAYHAKDGDIFIVRSNGNKALIGRSVLAKGVTGKVSHSGFTIRVRLSSSAILPSYLTHYLKSKHVHNLLIRSGEGANISSLNQKALASLPVRFPEKNEQLRLVHDIEAIQSKTMALVDVYEQKLAALDELKQSLLQQAFTGQLTQG
ncbi:restriction endonuclease subunit S [Vibrio fluvialis]|nr:restriction endonuclease subunit S [Vibrio fluvialis]MBY8139292.1 restriction endonuclease subunit S [Vibrio fluvialis]